MSLVRMLLLAAVAVLSCTAGDKAPSRVPAGAKVFIAPMEGNLNGFLAPEIVKKRLPLTVVTDEKDAEYVLTGGSLKADDNWYNSAFGGKDENDGNVQLLSVKDKQMVWAGEAGDRSMWWGEPQTRRITEGGGAPDQADEEGPLRVASTRDTAGGHENHFVSGRSRRPA